MHTLEDFFPAMGHAPAAPGGASLVAILDSIAEAVYLLDRQWRFIYLNRQAERLLRRPHAALFGHDFLTLFANGLDDEFVEQHRRALASGGAARFETYCAPLATWLDV